MSLNLLYHTFKPIYNELAYNVNPLLTNEFSKTDSVNSIRL